MSKRQDSQPLQSRQRADDVASMTALRARFGDGYQAKLDAAAEFVRNRPGLATLMRSSMGSNPQIVMALAEAAPNMRMKPRARKA